MKGKLLRLAAVRTPEGTRLHVRGKSGYVDVAKASGDDALVSLDALFAGGDEAWQHARDAATGEGVPVEPKDFGPVVDKPGKILCVGRNYREHALEGGVDVPTWPEIFVRFAESIVGPFDDIVKPSLSEKMDYEGELAVVIGTGGRYIPADRAMSAIAGYALLNDVSIRDWQRAATQWTAGKNWDATLPIGPELVTTDEVDIADLGLETRVNGTVVQSSRTSKMIFDIPSLVEFLSTFITLRPGDVIATGTPSGVGFARKPPLWLGSGDVVEIRVEGIGTIRNRVVAETNGPDTSRWQPLAGKDASVVQTPFRAAAQPASRS
jgi:2-keto-4-pentenoate hydratase/2-oxohepta-3-ene-1,7-dioic acid hydratase in catechol pathway